MLNKNKKLRGKPWSGRGRGRGDHGMEDMVHFFIHQKYFDSLSVSAFTIVTYIKMTSVCLLYLLHRREKIVAFIKKGPS